MFSLVNLRNMFYYLLVIICCILMETPHALVGREEFTNVLKPFRKLNIFTSFSQKSQFLISGGRNWFYFKSLNGCCVDDLHPSRRTGKLQILKIPQCFVCVSMVHNGLCGFLSLEFSQSFASRKMLV